MVSRENTLGLGKSSKIFLKLEIDGDLKLFNYYYTQYTYGSYNTMTGVNFGGPTNKAEKFLLQKGDEELMRPKILSYRKDLIQYLNDCPELSKKIEDHEFNFNDLESIVRFYNLNCK